ncbi:MAG: flavin reductase [Methanomicrobiales archaeon]|nr:flavin reductase [Methanomicrobiales archaeon]
MAKKVIILICALGAMLLFAGCMQPQQEGVTTPTTTPVTTAPTTVQPSPTTTPASTSADTIPPEKAVTISVLRDQITPKITVRFDGGKGQQQIRSIEVQVTRSDGQVLKNTLPARVNAEIEFDGTRGVDRVEIWVSYLDGSRYKLMNQLFDYFKR